MILRKPYAFLIKYFKLIHIIMFGMFVYFVFALRKIYMFFVNYVKTGNFTYLSNMTRQYISPILFLFAILIPIAAILIFLLMRKKQKPVLFYRLLIVYSIFFIVALVFYTTFFASLGNTTYSSLNIVIYRDIVAFLYYINYGFVGFNFIRGFGFDIKKFSFDKDKKELQLENEDSEEFEVGIQFDKDTVVSYLNREKRELKYYIKENSLVLSIIAIVLLVVFSVYLYNYFFIVNKVYKQSDEVIVDNVKYQINHTYRTKLDKYGSSLSSKDYFIVIDINIHNLDKITLDKENFRILVNNNFYYPHYNNYDDFNDLGEGYKNKELKENTNKNYLLMFKPKMVDYNDEAYLEILENKSGGKYVYNKIRLDFDSANKKSTKLKMNDNIVIDNYNFSIENYEIKGNDSYKYKESIGGKIYEFTKLVKPKNNNVVFVLKIKNNTESELPKDFINNYFGLIYDNQELSRKDTELIAQNEDTYYFSVPNNIVHAKEIILKVSSRKSEFDILIKEGTNE